MVPRATAVTRTIEKARAGTATMVASSDDAKTSTTRSSGAIVREVLDVAGRRGPEAWRSSGLPLVGRARTASKQVIRPVPVGPIRPPTFGPNEVPEAVATVATDAEPPTGRTRVALPWAVPCPLEAQRLLGVVALLLRRTLHVTALVPIGALDVLGASVEVAVLMDGVGEVTRASTAVLAVPSTSLPI